MTDTLSIITNTLLSMGSLYLMFISNNGGATFTLAILAILFMGLAVYTHITTKKGA